METVEKMDKYDKAVKAGEAQDLTNLVIRSWNKVKETGKSWMEEGDLDFAVNELTKLNNASTMHFEEVNYLKTTTESWLLMWDQYREAAERYVNTVSQRAGLMENQGKMADRMVRKLRSFMMEMNEAKAMPPLLLLTSGMLTAMIQSIREVSGALNKVSNMFDFLWLYCLLAGQVRSTCEGYVIISSQVEHTRPVKVM